MKPEVRKTVIAGNWKMNFTPREAKKFIKAVTPLVAGKDCCDIVFCAPYVTVEAAVKAAKGTNIHIGALKGPPMIESNKYGIPCPRPASVVHSIKVCTNGRHKIGKALPRSSAFCLPVLTGLSANKSRNFIKYGIAPCVLS